jgi:uncharacterized protein involved in exopolysaccharide biosynthesis
MQVALSPTSAVEFATAVIIRRWKLIFGCTVLSLLALYAAFLYFSPVYEVSASLLFKLGREMSPPATATSGQIVTAKRPEDVASEIEILRNQYLIQEVVRAFGVNYFLAEDPPVTFFQKVKATVKQASRAVKNSVTEALILAGVSKRLTPFDQIVAMLGQSLSVEAVRKSDVILLTLKTPDPEGGIAILNKLIELYLRQHIAVYKTPQARGFFEQQSETLRGRILQAHQGVSDFRDANGVWELNEQRQLLLRQKSDLEAVHMKTDSSIRHLDEELATLEEMKKGMPVQVELTRVSERNPVLKGYDEHLAQLEAAREQALTKFAPESRTVGDLAEQIKRLRETRANEEQMIVNSITSTRNENLAGLERNLVEKRGIRQGLAAQHNAEEQQISAIELRLRELDRTEVDVERWNRDLSQLNKSFQLYSEKLEDARISEAMDLAKISNVSVVAPATAGVFPVWPKKRTWTIGALALGIGGALGIIFLGEMIQPKVRSRGDILAAGMPLLGMIPEATRRSIGKPSRPLSLRAASNSGSGNETS